MDRKIVSSAAAPAAIGPYSQAIRGGNVLYCSGQLGIDPATGQLEEGIEAQTKRALANIGAILAAEGLGPANIVKTTIFLVDMADFALVNSIYGSYFDGAFPARSTVQVAGLPKGGRVEIEVLAIY